MAAPTVTTTLVSGVTPYSAVSGGAITSDGGHGCDYIGICWGYSVNPVWTSPNRTLHDHPDLSNVFKSCIIDLLPNTIYHYRAYAHNSDGVGYGADGVFTTQAVKYITITFAEQKVKTETIQLAIKFTSTDAGSDIALTAEDQGLKVTKWNNIQTSYNIEEGLLVVSNISLEIGDKGGVLDALFFDPLNVNVYKNALVTITLNSIIYQGNITEDSVVSNQGTKRITFDAVPMTDILNKRMVFGENGTDTSWADRNEYMGGGLYSIVDRYLLDAFRLVNPGLMSSDIQLVHNWTFQGETGDGDEKVYLDNIAFSELVQRPESMCLDNSRGVSSVGDLIKKLATDYCCFTGFISADKPFFKKLFHYNPDNTQTINALKWQKGYAYGLVDYIGITLEDVTPASYEVTRGVFTNLSD